MFSILSLIAIDQVNWQFFFLSYLIDFYHCYTLERQPRCSNRAADILSVFFSFCLLFSNVLVSPGCLPRFCYVLLNRLCKICFLYLITVCLPSNSIGETTLVKHLSSPNLNKTGREMWYPSCRRRCRHQHHHRRRQSLLLYSKVVFSSYKQTIGLTISQRAHCFLWSCNPDLHGDLFQRSNNRHQKLTSVDITSCALTS